MPFQKNITDPRKSNYVFHNSPIIRLLFYTKIFSPGVFHKNALIVACCSFGRFEMRTPQNSN